MQPIQILTVHLHRGITEKDIAFYQAVAALGEVWVAIPDDESYRRLCHEPALPSLEERRLALEARPEIALVFDVSLAMPAADVCNTAFLTLPIDAFACQRYRTLPDMHILTRVMQYLSQQRIPIISVDVDTPRRAVDDKTNRRNS